MFGIHAFPIEYVSYLLFNIQHLHKLFVTYMHRYDICVKHYDTRDDMSLLHQRDSVF